MSDFRNAQIRLLQKPLGVLNAVDIDVLGDRIAGNFLENPAEIIFAQVKLAGQLVKRNQLCAVLLQIAGHRVRRLIFASVNKVGIIRRLRRQFAFQPNQTRQNHKLYYRPVLIPPVHKFRLNLFEQMLKKSLLLLIQMVNSVVKPKKGDQIGMVKHPVEFRHLFFADI